MAEKRKIREESAVKAEIEQWEIDLDMHVQECPVCDQEDDIYCTEGQIINQILLRLTVELMISQYHVLDPKQKDRMNKRLDKKLRELNVGPPRNTTAGV